MLKPVLVLATLLAATGVMAADEITPQTRHYEYGMRLDVAEVVAIAEAPHQPCEPVQTRMTYRDSRGQLQAIEYIKTDAACD